MNKKLHPLSWLSYLLIGLLWFMFLFDDFEIALWRRIIGATVVTFCLVAAFQAGKYYFPKIETNKSEGLKLIGIAILIIAIITFQRYYLEELVEKARWENSPISIKLGFTAVIAAIMTSISVLFSWAYYLVDKNQQNELAISNLKALNITSELDSLKSRLNPHFLFNALSNIYSIAYLDDKRTPDKIMQLSKMLRYVIYDTDVQFISLEKEIEYLNYYIDFQKFKIKKEQQITFDYENCEEQVKIAPLLLQPLVENAFKHSRVAFEQNAWVNIALSTTEEVIFLKIENTISQQLKKEILNNAGVGLENIKKRLNLIYLKNYTFNITEKDTYKVVLKIKRK